MAENYGGRQSAFSLLNTIEHRLITEPANSHYLVFGLIKGFFFTLTRPERNKATPLIPTLFMAPSVSVLKVRL